MKLFRRKRPINDINKKHQILSYITSTIYISEYPERGYRTSETSTDIIIVPTIVPEITPKIAKKRAFSARAIGPATINNPTESDYTACRSAVATGILKYVTFNLEVGEAGTPHLQICAIASTQLTVTAWQKALGGRAANIVQTASPEDCRDYCQGFEVRSNRLERKEGSQSEDPLSETNHIPI